MRSPWLAADAAGGESVHRSEAAALRAAKSKYRPKPVEIYFAMEAEPRHVIGKPECNTFGQRGTDNGV